MNVLFIQLRIFLWEKHFLFLNLHVCVTGILGYPEAVSRTWRKGAKKVFKHGRKSPWVPTLTGAFPNGQAIFPCTHKLGERTGQLGRDNSSRVRIHEKNSGDAVSRLGTIIIIIKFRAKASSGIRKMRLSFTMTWR